MFQNYYGAWVDVKIDSFEFCIKLINSIDIKNVYIYTGAAPLNGT